MSVAAGTSSGAQDERLFFVQGYFEGLLRVYVIASLPEIIIRIGNAGS
jgi:hypothetical protein